ncbi:MAG: type II toxin-antitoxin system HicB family antitoxin [Actinobacteria bacterium]|nr:type II toxin-antitoxin system HicB family antitoxin [Actinomycetota bacterium]
MFEKTPNDLLAYLPDLPVCVATGDTHKEAARNIRAAVAFHLDGMRAEGLTIPQPTAWAGLVAAQA